MSSIESFSNWGGYEDDCVGDLHIWDVVVRKKEGRSDGFPIVLVCSLNCTGWQKHCVQTPDLSTGLNACIVWSVLLRFVAIFFVFL